MTQTLPLPEIRETRILVGTAVRKPLAVLQHYLQSLDWQELPPRHRLLYCFVADYPDPNDEALAYLKDWTAQRGGEVINGGPTALGDFRDTGTISHEWSVAAMQRVGRLKNRILSRASELRADYVFLADADLILDRTTIASLLSVGQPIACGVYWTHWQRPNHGQNVTVHAGPQVWLRHPYELSGMGLEEWEFRDRLIRRQLTKVTGQGACTLLTPQVWESGIDFTPLPDLPATGLWSGEDRHFCVHAERCHIPMWADPWPDIFHQYHLPEDLVEGAEMVKRLGAEHPRRARVGDLVSLTLTAMEGVPQPDGRQVQIPPQRVRGRLGALPLWPEVEEAVYGMDRGDTRIVPCHVPISYVIPQFRGQRRLIKVQVIDVKPYRVAPVIERELYVAPNGGGWLDATTLTPELHDLVAETANG